MQPTIVPPASPPVITEEQVAELVGTLAPRLRGDVRADAVTRALYATDASMYQVMPVAVLVPREEGDVQAAVEAANAVGVPVLPRGAGSSLAGQAVNAALVIDGTKHLNRICEVDAEAGWARVQPGLVLDHLNAHLLASGWTVGPDPAPSNRATLGGMVGNNATGTHSILYGNTVHHVEALRTVLADGSIVEFEPVDDAAWAARMRRSGREGHVYQMLDRLLADHAETIRRDTPKHWRRNSGYRIEHLLVQEEEGFRRNVAKLLCGSEGTLAVTTELTLRLVPRPRRTALGVVHFRTRRESLVATTTILETDPSAVELFDGVAIEQARRAPGFASKLAFLEGDPGAVLFVEYHGSEEAELNGKLDRLEERLRRSGEGYAVARFLEPQAIREVWTVRKEGLGLLMGVKGDHKPHAFIEDASVPVEHLADYIDDLLPVFDETDTKAVLYAHASAGCLHIRPFINTKDAAEVAKMQEIASASANLVRRYGGAVSSEHGDGRARSWLTPDLVGPGLYEVYRGIKRAFDPDGRFNPGIVVDGPPMDRDLRMGPTYGTLPVLEELDFSEDGGFARAIEMCNGNGACRKLQSGTMCPSFMVTREEQDSTRGRANALRNALAGAIPREELFSDRMDEVMDLCIQCKACKTECPSNVDLAKIKTQWLSLKWKEQPMPLRTRLFAHLPALARRLAGPQARVVNAVNRTAPVRALVSRALGLAPQRELPPFAPESFAHWFRRQDWRAEGAPLLLFADTFHNYQHPEAAQAAARFFDSVGRRVVVQAEGACCGRTLLSKGAVPEAKRYALRTLDILAPHVEAGLPVVGLEPSCILTFRDEFLALLPGDERARRLADLTFTFEEYVAHLADAGELDDVAWTDEAQTVLLHGHCHQKALVGTGPAERALGLPPNYRVETVDSGCCGMAGAFGYEREHYAVSLAMAERRLAPAVRAAADDVLIAAAGTSCRAQIADTTARTARHPAEILADALARVTKEE